ALLVEQSERRLVRPRVAIDAWRDERVVDVADREDPCVEIELPRFEAARITLAVESFVMAAHELADRIREAAQLAQELVPPLGMLADDRELVVVERARFLQDLL